MTRKNRTAMSMDLTFSLVALDWPVRPALPRASATTLRDGSGFALLFDACAFFLATAVAGWLDCVLSTCEITSGGRGEARGWGAKPRPMYRGCRGLRLRSRSLRREHHVARCGESDV